MYSDFVGFPKIARLSRACLVTEKIDGTNAQVDVRLDDGEGSLLPHVAGGQTDDGLGLYVWSERSKALYVLRAGCRTRWITPGKRTDNFGFAEWAYAHAQELVDGLGEGRHFGEWWGSGIQRTYGLSEKRFSLFNVKRWGDDAARPACCHVVPVLYAGEFTTRDVEDALDYLRAKGSKAVPGFMNPEGVVVFHVASGALFKKTLVGDEEPKSLRGGA